MAEGVDFLSPSRLSPFLSPIHQHANGSGGHDFLRERRPSTGSIVTSLSRSSSYSNLSGINRHRRSRRSSRVSVYDDDDDDDERRRNGEGGRRSKVTIMSVLEDARDVIISIGHKSSRLVSTLSKKSKLRPKIVCEGEILEHTSMVCRDYVVQKLESKDLVSKKLPVTPAHWPKSTHVIDACIALEKCYPQIYGNVSRKLCMTMTSTKIVRSAFNSMLDVLFEGETTWGKIVSMVSVCSLFAEECAMQGHLDFVAEVVDVVVDFTNSRLLEWFVSQGGWDSFPEYVSEEKRLEHVYRLLIIILCVVLLVAVCCFIMYQRWTC